MSLIFFTVSLSLVFYFLCFPCISLFFSLEVALIVITVLGVGLMTLRLLTPTVIQYLCMKIVGVNLL